MPKTLKRQSLGSGFVIDSQGIIVTNHHVVNQAEKIVVRLEKKEFEAQILGSDPATDLAILKIKPSKELPILDFADSSQMQVGDWVIAIGNPFGLSQTVTAGIVSATGRVIGQGPYDDFIQTDASINPGNSGGPLLNLNGEVIGINTAIFSQTGGNIGIGFAIPSNIAHGITEQLRAHGKVVRGWLGVAIQDLDEDLAKAFSLSEMQGALVADVEAGTPADTAGIKRGDVIVDFRGKSVKSAPDLSREVATTEPGTKAAIEIIRKGKKQTLTVKIGEQPSQSDAQ
jgi:serine protease Do